MVAQARSPSIAVVFDSAGTLLRTYRVVKDIPSREIYTDVETTAITAASDDRALLVLNVRSRDVMKAPPDLLLSEYLGTHQVSFGISCANRVFTRGEIADLLYADQAAKVSDLQECIRASKLERIADHLGIPRDHVHGVATPSIKARIVEDLQEQHCLVVMVGDGINDLPALEKADIAILTLQQPGEKPEVLYRAADHVVPRVRDVVTIVRDLARRN
jgi:soluble P-type ATPase